MPRCLCPLCAPERHEWAPGDAALRDALLAQRVGRLRGEVDEFGTQVRRAVRRTRRAEVALVSVAVGLVLLMAIAVIALT